jgi:hypothetical protein
VQMPAFAAMNNNSTSTDISSDLRSVGLWLVTNGSSTVGLARNELKQATSQDVGTDLTSLPDQNNFVFAKEVQNILFEYFDGTTWQPTWDGSTVVGEDGLSVIGPPAAIRVTLTLRKNNNVNNPDSNEPGATYQRIIALPTSNNFPIPTTTP